MYKKVSSLMLVMAMVFGLGISSYADDNLKADQKIKALADKYGCKTFDVNTKNVDEVIKLDSLEELEKLICDLKKTKTLETSINVSKNVNEQSYGSGKFEISPILSATKDSHSFKWSAPFTGWGLHDLACWKNVEVNYTYKHVNGAPRFVNIGFIESYLSGIREVYWSEDEINPRVGRENTKDDKVDIKIKGNYILCVNVNGFTIGMSMPEEWNVSLVLY